MIGLVLVAALAAASEAPSPVEEGVRLYEALQFERAALVLKRVAADSSISDSERARANLFLGLSSAQLLDEAGAREAFARAAELDPHVHLPAGVSPKVERTFRQALDLAAKRAVHMEVILPTGAANTELVSIEVRTTPPGRVNAVRLFVRREGDEAYNTTVLESAGGGIFRGKLQARTPAIELYVEADAEGARRAVFAAPETPARIPVSARMVFVPTQGPDVPPSPPSTPLYKQWWLYAIILVVAAGAAAGTYYAVTRPPPCGAGPGNGCVWININGP
jgi:hypothetical protein